MRYRLQRGGLFSLSITHEHKSSVHALSIINTNVLRVEVSASAWLYRIVLYYNKTCTKQPPLGNLKVA